MAGVQDLVDINVVAFHFTTRAGSLAEDPALVFDDAGSRGGDPAGVSKLKFDTTDMPTINNIMSELKKDPTIKEVFWSH